MPKKYNNNNLNDDDNYQDSFNCKDDSDYEDDNVSDPAVKAYNERVEARGGFGVCMTTPYKPWRQNSKSTDIGKRFFYTLLKDGNTLNINNTVISVNLSVDTDENSIVELCKHLSGTTIEAESKSVFQNESGNNEVVELNNDGGKRILETFDRGTQYSLQKFIHKTLIRVEGNDDQYKIKYNYHLEKRSGAINKDVIKTSLGLVDTIPDGYTLDGVGVAIRSLSNLTSHINALKEKYPNEEKYQKPPTMHKAGNIEVVYKRDSKSKLLRYNGKPWQDELIFNIHIYYCNPQQRIDNVKEKIEEGKKLLADNFNNKHIANFNNLGAKESIGLINNEALFPVSTCETGSGSEGFERLSKLKPKIPEFDNITNEIHNYKESLKIIKTYLNSTASTGDYENMRRNQGERLYIKLKDIARTKNQQNNAEKKGQKTSFVDVEKELVLEIFNNFMKYTLNDEEMKTLGLLSQSNSQTEANNAQQDNRAAASSSTKPEPTQLKIVYAIMEFLSKPAGSINPQTMLDETALSLYLRLEGIAKPPKTKNEEEKIYNTGLALFQFCVDNKLNKRSASPKSNGPGSHKDRLLEYIHELIVPDELQDVYAIIELLSKPLGSINPRAMLDETALSLYLQLEGMAEPPKTKNEGERIYNIGLALFQFCKLNNLVLRDGTYKRNVPGLQKDRLLEYIQELIAPIPLNKRNTSEALQANATLNYQSRQQHAPMPTVSNKTIPTPNASTSQVGAGNGQQGNQAAAPTSEQQIIQARGRMFNTQRQGNTEQSLQKNNGQASP